MKRLHSLIAFSLAALPFPAAADPDKDESGHGRHGHHGAYKQEWWDGNCKVERKYKPNGDYKEERKCKNVHAPAVVYVPAPVYAPAPVTGPVVVEPGIVIQGTVRVR